MEYAQAQSAKEIWQTILQNQAQMLPDHDFSCWIKPLKPVRMDQKSSPAVLYLQAPNSFVKTWVVEKHQKDLDCWANEAYPGSVKVCVDALETARLAPAKPLDSGVRAQAYPERGDTNAYPSPGLERRYLFERFVMGTSNQVAFVAAERVANQFSPTSNPLVIYGDAGLGKTHLMHAIGHRVREKNPQVRIILRSGHEFFQEMLDAINTNSVDWFREYYRGANVILLDDIHFLADKKKERTQEELFIVLNSCLPAEANRQFVATCDRVPNKLILPERLKSRLSCGLGVHLDPPELETRVAILHQKVIERGYDFELAADTAMMIAEIISSNVRELEGALSRISTYVTASNGIPLTAQGRPLVMPEMASAWLRDLLAAHMLDVTIAKIQATVAEYYHLGLPDLVSRDRRSQIVRPRQLAMALCKKLTKHSLPDIGAAFNNRDHATVIHAVKRINELMQKDMRLAEDYKVLVRRLSE